MSRHAANLPETGETDQWHVTKPTWEARRGALAIIKFLAPEDYPPASLAVTLDRGVELEWQKGQKTLAIEVDADGSLEILASVASNPIFEGKLKEPDFRVSRFFYWLDALP